MNDTGIIDQITKILNLVTAEKKELHDIDNTVKRDEKGIAVAAGSTLLILIAGLAMFAKRYALPYFKKRFSNNKTDVPADNTPFNIHTQEVNIHSAQININASDVHDLQGENKTDGAACLPIDVPIHQPNTQCTITGEDKVDNVFSPSSGREYTQL